MSNRCLGKPHRSEEQTLGLHAQTVQRPPASQVRGPGELLRWKPPAGNGLLSSYSWASSTPRLPLVLGTLSHHQLQVKSQVQTSVHQLTSAQGSAVSSDSLPSPALFPSHSNLDFPESWEGGREWRAKQAETGLLNGGG